MMPCPICTKRETTDVLRVIQGNPITRQHRCTCGARWQSVQPAPEVVPTSVLMINNPGYRWPGLADRSGSNRGSPPLPVAAPSNGGVGGGLPKNPGITSRSQKEIFGGGSDRSGSNWIDPNDPIQPQKRRRRSTLPVDHSAAFLAFWSAYPRKVAKAKAWEIWFRKGAEAKTSLIMSAIGWQAREIFQMRIDAGEVDRVPHPATWLNQARWEDERPSRPPLRSIGGGGSPPSPPPLPAFTPRPRDDDPARS